MSSAKFRQFHCEYCDLTLNGHAPYTMHLAGKKHLKKLKAHGESTQKKGPQGVPDSTVADTAPKLAEGYGGKFVSASGAKKTSEVDTGTKPARTVISTESGKPTQTNSQSSNDVTTVTSTQPAKQAQTSVQSSNYTQSSQNGYKDKQTSQRTGYTTGQNGSYTTGQSGTYGGYSSGYGNGYGNGYSSDQYGGKTAAGQYRSSGHYGYGGQYDYSGQYGYSNGQYDYSTGQYPGYVSYPSSAVSGQQIPPPATTTTETSDPVMKAIRANALGKLPKKRKMLDIKERCQVCNIDLSSQQHKQQHMEGKKHLKKVKLYGDSGEKDQKRFFCELCEKQLNSPEQFEQHRIGLNHQKKVNKQMQAKLEAKALEPPAAKKKFVISTAISS